MSPGSPRRWIGRAVWAPSGCGRWEDCRHVSGSFERFLLVHGERVLRVATRLMAGARRGGRERGKSDLIDALAVARAALREGVDRLPLAELAGVELDIRLLVDHRERLVRMRVALYNDLLWHLHDLWPEQAFPGCALLSKTWTTTIGRRLARAEQTARVRIARAYSAFSRSPFPLDLTPGTVEQLVSFPAPPPRGWFDEVLKVDTAFSLGFARPLNEFRFGSSQRAFGHPGAGGSFAFADPERDVAFAYVMNRLGFYLNDDPREKALRDALYRSL